MINTVTLVGRIVAEPVSRKAGEMSVVSFTLAVNEGKDKVSFLPCVAWDKLGEIVAKYTHKGTLLGVSGRLSQRTYEKADKSKVSLIELILEKIQLLDAKPTEAEIKVVEATTPIE